MSELALFGGSKALTCDEEKRAYITNWPIYTKEDEDAVVDVLHKKAMSGTDITKKFEEEFARWQGVKYALGFCNGTASILGALYGAGVRRGDEVICPSVVYWAAGAIQTYQLGATPVFADIDEETLCISPEDIERKITDKTKAIVVVHYCSHPCDMDAIMAIAKKYDVKVIEDVSHAQGGYYKGKKLGTFGDVSAMSLMTGKSFAVGEGGMLVTNNKEIYEHVVALGHYERFNASIESEDLKPFAGLPMGGYKFRMHQMSSAVGRVQLKYYDERCREIRKAMNYFWDLLEGVPGIRAHRVNEADGSNMAGWYAPHGIYVSEELEGLSVTRFCEAVRAEGVWISPGANLALHTHNLFSSADVYADGKPTRIAHSLRDVRDFDKYLDKSEKIGTKTFSIPWLIKYEPEVIEQYACAFKKVALNYKELLKDDKGNPPLLGGWHFFKHSK